MSIKCLTNRQFGSLNIKAEWSKIDRIVEDIKQKDKNNEIDAIGIVKGDIYDGELFSCAIIVAIGKESASYELYKSVNNHFVAFEKEDRIPSDFIAIWER